MAEPPAEEELILLVRVLLKGKNSELSRAMRYAMENITRVGVGLRVDSQITIYSEEGEQLMSIQTGLFPPPPTTLKGEAP